MLIVKTIWQQRPKQNKMVGTEVKTSKKQNQSKVNWGKGELEIRATLTANFGIRC